VNPRSREEVAESIKEALTMPVEEQKERNRAMQRRLHKYNVIRWSGDFLDSLERVKSMQKDFCGSILIEEKRKDLIKRYTRSKHRLLLLDYDGTLVPFSKRPDKAVPDKEILKRLRILGRNDGNEVVIISGRDRKTVEKWFGELGIGLVAEHGVWLKEKGKRWKLIEPMRNDWKKQVYPMLEFYADRTPRSFVEDKEYSLVWHYRRTDPELGQLRAREMKDALLSLTENLNLEVLEGNKIVEIKNVGINKGRAASFWLKQRRWDFILAIGDDWTDEFTFEALPEKAYSIKVGLGVSKARFNTPSCEEVRELLKELGSK
jgi:trehalose 6-phosphate synthase/phosphatase